MDREVHCVYQPCWIIVVAFVIDTVWKGRKLEKIERKFEREKKKKLNSSVRKFQTIR